MFLKLKICAISVLFFLSMSALFSHTGLGASFSYSASTSPYAAFSFTARSDLSPWCVFFNSHLGENTISVFADDWFINERISNHLDYFVFWGISGGFRFDDELSEISTGCRFGAGLDLFLLTRHLEFIAQSVWNPYFGVKKEDGNYSPLFRPVNFPCTAGIRLYY